MKLLLPCLLSASLAAAQSAPLLPVGPAVPRRLVAAQAAFGFDLLRQVSREQPRANAFLSPLGVALALYLVLDGTADASRPAVAAALRVAELPADTLRAGVASLLAGAAEQPQRQPLRHLPGLASSGAQAGAPLPELPVFQLATSLWVDQHWQLPPAYATQMQARYRARATSLNFGAPGAADTINHWVSQQTRGRVPALVQPGSLGGPLLLLSAAYFKGQWRWPFEEHDTRPGRFHGPGGASRVPLMRERATGLGYLAGPGWQAVRLPYAGDAPYSLQVFVPRRLHSLPAFLRQLTARRWATWQAGFQQKRPAPLLVDLTLPRFQLTWQRELLPALQALGLPPVADFAPLGFGPDQPSRLKVTHQAFLRVDERGTEAAAATAVEMVVGFGGHHARPRRVVVRATRPFFCAIVDDRTGSILFSGVVYRPE